MANRIRSVLNRLAVAIPLALLTATWISTDAKVLRQITDAKSSRSGSSTLDDAGATVWTNSCGDPFGTNPDHAFQIVRWDAVTGLGEQVSAFGDGVGWTSGTVSVSDDGQWIAFISPADLTGGNHDESAEIFVMRSDGSGITQVTNDPDPNAGTAFAVALSGSANRIVFSANSDPLGTNPNHRLQLFAIDRNGANLHQLTNLIMAEDYLEFAGSISDDGQRIAFASSAQVVAGGNPDGGYEVYGVNSDGTGLRQLTAAATGSSGHPVISGDGAKIVFESTSALGGANPLGLSHIVVINWDGTGVRRLTPSPGSGLLLAAERPWITDDAVTVVYSDNFVSASANPDGNREIWKVRTDGTGRSTLTHTASPVENRSPVISGSGNRVAYHRGAERRVVDGTGGNDVVLEPAVSVPPGYPNAPEAVEITPDGSRIVFESGAQIYRIQADGSDLFQVTGLAQGFAENPSIAGDGQTIAFYSAADPLGQNPLGREQIFVIQADGSGLRQLTHSDGYSELSYDPFIAANGQMIVFQSNADLTGDNPGYDPQLFRMRPDGSDAFQITHESEDGGLAFPRIDAQGTWLVYQSTLDTDGLNPDRSFEIFRIKSDGSSIRRITADPQYPSYAPDISGSGDRLIYVSQGDPLGTNPDHNAEVFLHEISSGATHQLTDTSGQDCRLPRISQNGEYVAFSTAAPVFEDDPSDRIDCYRVEVATGVIERVGALRRGPSSLRSGHLYRDFHVAIDGAGRREVLGAAPGDWAGTNPDYDQELYVADHTVVARIEPSKTSPTVVRWDPEPASLRYDIVRGDVTHLRIVGGTVDLGPVVCLEDDSPDTSTEGFGDATEPTPGQVFFFVHRGTQGLLAGPGSYGRGSAGAERIAGGGDCTP